MEEQVQDERYQPLKVYDFSKGYMDALAPEYLPDEASPDCLNVLCRTAGDLKRRPSFDKVASTGGEGIINLFPFYSEDFTIIGKGFNYYAFEKEIQGDSGEVSGSLDRGLREELTIGLVLEEEELEEGDYVKITSTVPISFSGIDELFVNWMWLHGGIVMEDWEESKKELVEDFKFQLIDSGDNIVKEVFLGYDLPEEEIKATTSGKTLVDVSSLEGLYYVRIKLLCSYTPVRSRMLAISQVAAKGFDDKSLLVASVKENGEEKIKFFKNEVKDENLESLNINLPLDDKTFYQFEQAIGSLVAFSGRSTPWVWNGLVVEELEEAPAEGRNPVYHHARLFVSTQPSLINWCEPYNLFSWPGVNYMYVGTYGDGIVSMRRLRDALVIFKDRSTYVLRGASKLDFHLEEVSTSLGCVGPQAALFYGGGIILVTQRGLETFDGVNFEPLSQAIPRLWDGLVKEEDLGSIVLSEKDSLIFMSVPSKDLVLVYDLRTGAIWPWKKSITCMTSFMEETGNVYFYSGGKENGYITSLDKEGDKEVVYPAYWVSKPYGLDVPSWYKKTKNLYLETSSSSKAKDNLELVVNVDNTSLTSEDEKEVIKRKEDDYITKYLLNQPRPWWRYISFKFNFKEDSEDLVIKGLEAQAKLKPLSKVRGEA